MKSHSARVGVVVMIVSVMLVAGLSVLSRADAAPIPESINSITVTIICPGVYPPACGTTVTLPADTLFIRVWVDSTYELQSIVAQVDTLTTTLVGYEGFLSVASLPLGTYTLTVTATDIFGNSGQAQKSVHIDRPPVVHITAPDDYTVARPDLAVNMWCTDDDPAGCQTVDVVDECGGIALAHGTTSISQTLSLAAYNGRRLDLCFQGYDSALQPTREQRIIYVDSSPLLVETDRVDGEIWDINADHILFRQNDTPTETLKIRDRQTGQDTIVMSDPARHPQFGYLTPHGTMFVEQSGDVLTAVLYEWRDGELIDLGPINSASWFKVAGDYAIWNDDRKLFRRDLALSTTLQIADNAGNIYNDVAANGDVVYWAYITQSQIIRYRNGIITALTSDTAFNFYPATDGVNVVYRKRTGTTCSTVLYDPQGEITLAPYCSVYDHDYQLSNGWIAFTRPNSFGQVQVWRRSPTGILEKLTYFGTESEVDSIGPNGEVTIIYYDNTFIYPGLMYLSVPGRPLLVVSTGLGQTYWLDDKPFKTIGRSVFRVLSENAYLPLVVSSSATAK